MRDTLPPLVDVGSLTALAPDARRSETTRAICRRRLSRLPDRSIGTPNVSRTTSDTCAVHD
jgi:hypothetical protein